jgi:SAM-dependent methyltransferase
MFDRVAGDYEARPDYPRDVFDVLVERCGLGPGARVLEIGAGSGQATLPLLDRGAQVTAVEPGDALARRLVERTSGRSIDVIVSVFEDVELAEASFDLAASATAFHWVDLAVGLERCARFLRDGGWLALWWTFWGDPDRSDPFHEALQPVLRQKAPHLVAEETGARAHMRDIASRAAEIERTRWFEMPEEESMRWEASTIPRRYEGSSPRSAGGSPFRSPCARSCWMTSSGWPEKPSAGRSPVPTRRCCTERGGFRDERDGGLPRRS